MGRWAATDKDDAASKVTHATTGSGVALAAAGQARVTAVTHLREAETQTTSSGQTTYKIKSRRVLGKKRIGPRLIAGQVLELYNKFAQDSGQEWQYAEYKGVTPSVKGFVRLNKITDITTEATTALAEVGQAMVIGKTHLREAQDVTTTPQTTSQLKKRRSWFKQRKKRIGPPLEAGAVLTLYNRFTQTSGAEWQLAEYRKVTPYVKGFVRSSKVLKVGARPGLTRGQETGLVKYRAPSRGEGWKGGLETGGSVLEWLTEQPDVIGGGTGGLGELFGVPSEQYKNWWEATHGATFKSNYLLNHPGATDEDISEAMDDKIEDHWSDWSISKPFDLVSKITDVVSSGFDVFSGAFGTLFGLIGMAGGIVGAIKAGDTWERLEEANTALESGVGSLFGVGKVITGTGGVVTKSGVLGGGGGGWETAKNVFGFIGDGLGTVKSALETMWGVVKIVYASVKQAKKGGNTEGILAETAGTIKALFETGEGAVKTTKGVLDTFSTVSGVAGAIFGAVTAAINIVTTLVSLVVEGYGFIKQAYKLVTGYMKRKRLMKLPGSALVKHLKTITWKRIKRAWGEITLKGANIIIMKRVANLPAINERNKSTYDEVQLLLQATGVDLAALFKENGNPQEQVKMLIEAMRARE